MQTGIVFAGLKTVICCRRSEKNFDLSLALLTVSWTTFVTEYAAMLSGVRPQIGTSTLEARLQELSWVAQLTGFYDTVPGEDPQPETKR